MIWAFYNVLNALLGRPTVFKAIWLRYQKTFLLGVLLYFLHNVLFIFICVDSNVIYANKNILAAQIMAFKAVFLSGLGLLQRIVCQQSLLTGSPFV